MNNKRHIKDIFEKLVQELCDLPSPRCAKCWLYSHWNVPSNCSEIFTQEWVVKPTTAHVLNTWQSVLYLSKRD